MAEEDYVNQVTEFPPISSPSRSIPLTLSGFLAGDTVRVQGETGDLEFSLKFSIQRRDQNHGGPGNFSDANILEMDTFGDESVDSLSSASLLTPTSGHETPYRDAGENELSQGSWMKRRDDIVTRLRSGVLSPVKYNASCSYGVFRGRVSSGKKMRMETGRGRNAFERMLKRRSFPLRPCNSYAFFVMANWGVVKCSSFEETSKRLSKKWCQLPNDMKKEYENLASKDNARYVRQCLLLKNDVEEESGSGLLEDMK